MTRRRQLAVLAAQLHELTTEEERESYPFFDHLQDLIADMEMEEDGAVVGWIPHAPFRA